MIQERLKSWLTSIYVRKFLISWFFLTVNCIVCWKFYWSLTGLIVHCLLILRTVRIIVSIGKGANKWRFDHVSVLTGRSFMTYKLIDRHHLRNSVHHQKNTETGFQHSIISLTSRTRIWTQESIICCTYNITFSWSDVLVLSLHESRFHRI